MPKHRFKRGLSQGTERLDAGWEREARRLRLIKAVFSVSLFALTIVVAMVLWLVFTYRPSPPEPSRPYLWEWQEIVASQRTGGRLLGEHLYHHHPQVRVLIMVPESMDDIHTATLEGLLAALDFAELEEVVVETLAQGGQNELTDGHFWLDPAEFDRIAAAYPGTDVVVSIAGLPRHPQRMQFWRRRPRPELMLINVDIFRLAELIRAGGIAAAVIRSPGYVLPEGGEFDPHDEELWVIVTADNLSRIRRKHPSLFAPEEDEAVWRGE